ncbi:MAG TPA: NADH-quinone oxidoreductase subunit J [Gemmataceae bacterium]|jgi:NADH:ubiquinone oxidoreductase subunit 6 (subunit J)|nr:NADH-quinone oxidoreductase subunit J [Gemmataceae bacterium]
MTALLQFLGHWKLLLPLLLAAVGVWLLLPRPRNRAVVWGALSALAALILAGIFWVRWEQAVSAEVVLFYAFSGMAILGGVALIGQHNPARAAVSFAIVVVNVCGLFLLQAAPFLMAATIIIYAGAIIVTFLFVLMLAQQEGFSNADDRSREPFLASFAGFVLLGAFLFILDRTFPDPKQFNELLDRAEAAAKERNVAEIKIMLGDKDEYLNQLQREARRYRGTDEGVKLQQGLDDLTAEWNARDPNAREFQNALATILDAGRRIQERNRPASLPAANVANLGRTLFSDYLLAVELGGTLLLVATIGAIAIAHRRREAPA